MTANKFLNICFIFGMCYQLYSITITPSENNTNKLIANSDSIGFTNFNTICHDEVKPIEHLEKPSKYAISKKGKDFIKKHEICVLHAYNDPDPKRRSVGWGHQIRPGENLEHISQQKADELFEQDIKWVNDAINRLIAQNDNRFIYSQGFIDGLGSLIYNCGERGVTLTKFYERWQNCRYDKNSKNYINMNDFTFAIAAVKTSRISAPGHIKRRYNEHKLMLN